MKKIKPCARKTGHFRSEWLMGVVITFVLGILLTAYTPSGSQAAPAPGTKTSTPAGSKAPAAPKELPSKGSPNAKLTVLRVHGVPLTRCSALRQRNGP